MVSLSYAGQQTHQHHIPHVTHLPSSSWPARIAANCRTPQRERPALHARKSLSSISIYKFPYHYSSPSSTAAAVNARGRRFKVMPIYTHTFPPYTNCNYCTLIKNHKYYTFIKRSVSFPIQTNVLIDHCNAPVSMLNYMNLYSNSIELQFTIAVSHESQ